MALTDLNPNLIVNSRLKARMHAIRGEIWTVYIRDENAEDNVQFLHALNLGAVILHSADGPRSHSDRLTAEFHEPGRYFTVFVPK